MTLKSAAYFGYSAATGLIGAFGGLDFNYADVSRGLRAGDLEAARRRLVAALKAMIGIGVMFWPA